MVAVDQPTRSNDVSALLFEIGRRQNLALLRRRAPLTGLWTTGVISAAVAAMGLVWFVERVS